MFRLYDATTGLTGPVQPARPGTLRIWVTGGAATEPAGLRRCLVADVLRRVADRHHLRAAVWHAPGDEDALRTAWSDLNIHPAEFATSPPGAPDVTISPGTGGAGGRAVWPGDAAAAGLDGLDPLALRLALLERPYRAPAHLSRSELDAAGQTLGRWRALVAQWADSPSKPMCAQYVGDVLGALDDDLDTPAALRTMHALAADAELPPGSRFEAFAYLDRLLGLDLARDIGR